MPGRPRKQLETEEEQRERVARINREIDLYIIEQLQRAKAQKWSD